MSTIPSSNDVRVRTWPLRTAAVVLALLGLFPLSNYLSSGIGQQWWAPAVRYWIVVGGLLLLVSWLLGAAFPTQVERLLARGERLLLAASDRTFMACAAFTCAMLALGFGWWLFHWQAVTIDELSQQFQGRLLSLGHLSARAEPHGEFFSTLQTAQIGDRFFSQFPIGDAALKAIGLMVGQPWVINPLLLAIGAIAVYRFFANVAGERDARLTVLLFALSPFVLFIAASQLDHVAALAGVWVALAALPRWLSATDEAGRTRAAATVGAAIGITATIRPYDAVLYAAGIGLFQLVHAVREPQLRRSFLFQLAAGLIPAIALLAVNQLTTGNALTFAYDVANGPEHRPGFHLAPLGFEHTPKRGIFVLSAYLMKLDVALLGWAAPALLFIVAALLMERRPSRWDCLLLGAGAIAFVGYWLYWGEGFFQGPRFLYPLAPVFLYYTARLPIVARERLSAPAARAGVALLYPILLLACWLLPSSRKRPTGIWTMADHAREWSNANDLLLEGVRLKQLHNAVVFVSDGWHARLSARLRQLGARPFMAQRIVGNYDACMLQRLLDHADSMPNTRERSAFVFGVLDQAPTAEPVPHLTSVQQLAFTRGVPMPAECSHEREWAQSNGLDLARLLPLNGLDSLGRIGGDVVFARDFGQRDEMLRDRFGDRSWYVARVDLLRDSLRLTLEPLPSPAQREAVAPHRTDAHDRTSPPR